jgi:transketolase
LIVDYNKLQSFGPVAEVMPLEPLADKLRAFGFAVREVDGHDVEALRKVLVLPFEAGRPGALIAHTIKGGGIAVCEHDPAWHHKASFDAAAGDALRRALMERADA